MNLSQPFIRRPVMTVLLALTVIVWGAYSYSKLPVNDLPAVDYPVIQVQVAYPGASPETMANNVATPLERQFMQIPGLELVTSKSGQGNTSFSLQFALSKSLDSAATDTQVAITQATGNLPVDLPSPPTLSKNNPNDQPIMYLALTSDTATQGQIYDFANTQVSQQISILPGVSRVQVYGTKGAVRIKADPSKLASRGMTIATLQTAIQSGTSYSGAGQFDNANETMILRPQGQLENAEAYNKLIIATGTGGAPVFLRDVATATDAVQDERIHMSFWSREFGSPSATVVCAVNRQAGGNAVAVTAAIRALLPRLNAELPPSVRLTPIYDRSVTIVNSINDVQETLLIAFVLVLVVIFLFLGRARDTLIPAVALPLSLLITFVAMWMLDYSLDNLSLMALTLAIGLLVDDAIVFLENTVRRMEEGESAMQATFNSAKEISFTILSMTLSLAAVFLPLVLLPGLMGRIFREFSLTIIIAIFASGIVSLTVTPMMCSRLLARRGPKIKKPWLERVASRVEHFVLGIYGRTLTWALRFHLISAVVWVVCLFGTGYFLVKLPKSFLPVGDSGFIFGLMIGPDKASYMKMRQYQDRAEKVMQANDAVSATFTMTGNGQFLTYNQGLLLAFLEPRAKRGPIAEIAGPTGLMGHVMGAVPGILPIFNPQPVLKISTGAAADNTSPLTYAISGTNPEEVYKASQALLPKLQEFKGFASVRTDYYSNQPYLNVKILREQASIYGISVTRIEKLLANSFSQNYLYLIKRPSDQYQVILEAENKDREQPQDLSKLYITTDDGKRTVPLDAVVKWEQQLGLQQVNHINQFTSVTFAFNLIPGTSTGDATDFIQKTAAATLPGTIRGALQGEAKTFTETISALVILMGVAVAVMYVILGILYESYLHPITVLSSLPVALVGGLATLWGFGILTTGKPMEASLYAYVGMFLLMGIVKKNGIMIVDFALQRIGQGETAEKAIHDASMDRFRPIIMTTVAAVMGALPIAMKFGADGESRQSLGLVIVGGLFVSQFLTLYVTPVIFLYLERFQEGVLDRTSFFRSSRHQQHDGVELDPQPAAGVALAAGQPAH